MLKFRGRRYTRHAVASKAVVAKYKIRCAVKYLSIAALAAAAFFGCLRTYASIRSAWQGFFDRCLDP